MHPGRSTKEQFNQVVTERLEKIKSVLSTKAKEYSSDNDRYHNFSVAARMQGITPEQALKGMMLKHEVAVNDLIEWASVNDNRLTLELIDEKIGDNINYLILLEGLLKRRIDIQNFHKKIA